MKNSSNAGSRTRTSSTSAASGTIRRASLSTIVVDTTVQPKAIAHPTDSRLLDRAREHLVAAAQHEGITLRQSYARLGPGIERQAGRYAHAKQYRRMRGQHRHQPDGALHDEGAGVAVQLAHQRPDLPRIGDGRVSMRRRTASSSGAVMSAIGRPPSQGNTSRSRRRRTFSPCDGGQRHVGASPQRDQLRLTPEGVPEAPPLPAGGRHLQVQAGAVEHPARLLAGLRGTDRGACESHLGQLPRHLHSYAGK